MRRRPALLGAAALAIIAAGAGLILWLVASPGFLNTARTTTDPVEIAAIAATDLGRATLPEGVTGVGLHEDGFQDRIVWIRLEATDAGLDALLATLDLARGDLSVGAPLNVTSFETLKGVEWWRPPATARVVGATELSSPTLAYLTLTVIEDGATPGLWHLYLRGHEI